MKNYTWYYLTFSLTSYLHLFLQVFPRGHACMWYLVMNNRKFWVYQLHISFNKLSAINEQNLQQKKSPNGKSELFTVLLSKAPSVDQGGRTLLQEKRDWRNHLYFKKGWLRETYILHLQYNCLNNCVYQQENSDKDICFTSGQSSPKCLEASDHFNSFKAEAIAATGWGAVLINFSNSFNVRQEKFCG